MGADLDRLLDEPVLEEPRMLIDEPVWRQVVAWATVTDTEVSGMGVLEPNGDGYRMVQAYLLPQLANDVETHLAATGLSGLIGDMIAEGMDPSTLRVWWHSHAREAPFWSGLDDHTIDSFTPVSMVSLVIDHRRRRLCRLDRYEPRRLTNWVPVDGADRDLVLRPAELELAKTDVQRVVGQLTTPGGLRRGGHH